MVSRLKCSVQVSGFPMLLSFTGHYIGLGRNVFLSRCFGGKDNFHFPNKHWVLGIIKAWDFNGSGLMLLLGLKNPELPD